MDPDAFARAVSATEPDWTRETPRAVWDPGRRLLRTIRRHAAARAARNPLRRATAPWWALWHRVWSVVTQCDIPLGTRIGGGLMLPHPTGIVIHPESRIGPNCLIFQQVTLAGPVRLGGHCDLGAGAKLMGPLRLGDHVQVGANAVVTRDAGDGAVLAGIPARDIAARAGDDVTGGRDSA